jgi:hypothetical protein
MDHQADRLGYRRRDELALSKGGDRPGTDSHPNGADCQQTTFAILRLSLSNQSFGTHFGVAQQATHEAHEAG